MTLTRIDPPLDSSERLQLIHHVRRLLTAIAIVLCLGIALCVIAYIGHHRPPAVQEAPPAPAVTACLSEDVTGELSAASGEMAELPPGFGPETTRHLDAAAGHIQAARTSSPLCPTGP